MIDPHEHLRGEVPPEESPASLRSGCVLVARGPLEDPNFKSTVVLICAYNSDGAFGLVLNRPSHMPLTEVFSMQIPADSNARTIYIGGPVQQDSLQVLQVTDTPSGSALKIGDGVYLGGEWESIDDILREEESKLKLFLGYSGWGPDQLETEVRLGAWFVLRVAPRLLVGREEQLRGTPEQMLQYLRTLRE
jgi:putative transcriptional regulator